MHQPGPSIKTDFHVAFYLGLPKSNPDVGDVHLIDAAFDHAAIENRWPKIAGACWADKAPTSAPRLSPPSSVALNRLRFNICNVSSQIDPGQGLRCPESDIEGCRAFRELDETTDRQRHTHHPPRL